MTFGDETFGETPFKVKISTIDLTKQPSSYNAKFWAQYKELQYGNESWYTWTNKE